ncbi:MAG: Hsp70 family protein [Muribaculaceae bacterium]|nr:Hsp70 family protein [Muribaculaceae bacterium]
MANNKIIYGIDLGTTNSAIARFENGQSVIKKSPTQGDTTPSCVTVTPKGKLIVGAKAYSQLDKDSQLAYVKPGYKRNTYVEFKRIMGTDEKYYSYNLEKSGQPPYLTPEQLSSEVLKTLRSYILDDEVKEAVITVPALFNNNQRDATKRAAKLAGFDHFELIQEPVAASVAYGLASKMKNAYWLVFDFGGGTFDAALMCIEDGIMKAVDTAGNNHLGGKDIDQAIVEQIILPYLAENFSIEGCAKKEEFIGMWKAKAEEAKIQLSFNDEVTVQTDLGDEYGVDDDGNELELDLTITEEDLEPVAGPIFQRAIDITKQLLNRNNISGSELGALILVGGPTQSRILRRMLREQITPNVDTSIDPMTAVACGAALYGSTIDVPEEVMDKKRDRSKIQLEVSVKSTSVEEFEFAAVKFLKDKSEGYGQDSVMVDFVRTDGEFNTGRVKIDQAGDAIELRLKTDATNVFEIRCYDIVGNKLDCEPQSISIIQGIDGIGDAKLPQSLGMATVDDDDDVVFTPFEGLKKNMPLPAYGTLSKRVITDRDIRPGMSSDKIIIPILQTDKDIDQLKSEKKKLKKLYCDHLYDIVVTGDDIPSVLPKGKEVKITIHAEKSGGIDECIVDIPYLNIDIDVTNRLVSCTGKVADVDVYLADIEEARKKLGSLNDEDLNQQLSDVASVFNSAQAQDRDKKEQALVQLKEVLAKIDQEYSLGDWQRMENKLKGIYEELINDNRKYGNEKTTTVVRRLKDDVDRVIEAKDMEAAQQLYDQIWDLDFKLAAVEFYIVWIRQWSRNFKQKQWSNPSRARSLIDQGLEIINGGKATAENLRPIVVELNNMLPRSQKPQNIGLLHQQN